MFLITVCHSWVKSNFWPLHRLINWSLNLIDNIFSTLRNERVDNFLHGCYFCSSIHQWSMGNAAEFVDSSCLWKMKKTYRYLDVVIRDLWKLGADVCFESPYERWAVGLLWNDIQAVKTRGLSFPRVQSVCSLWNCKENGWQMGETFCVDLRTLKN